MLFILRRIFTLCSGRTGLIKSTERAHHITQINTGASGYQESGCEFRGWKSEDVVNTQDGNRIHGIVIV